jgi:hypothetical protein
VRPLSAEMKQCDWMDVVGEGNLVDLLACLFLSSLATKLERTGTFCEGLRPRPAAEILEARMNTTTAARAAAAATIATTSNEMIVVCRLEAGPLND